MAATATDEADKYKLEMNIFSRLVFGVVARVNHQELVALPAFGKKRGRLWG